MTKTEEILKEIADERVRQIEEEGYDAKHDRDEHPKHELAWAAVCYAAPTIILKYREGGSSYLFHDPWPFHAKFDKRHKHDYRRRLVIAGAFIAAEIERMDSEATRT